jgi:NADH dehydrogenase
VQVRPDCTLPGHPELFVVGELMALVEGLPGLAEVAMQSGRHAARAITPRLQGRPASLSTTCDLSTMATISRFRAMVSLGRLRFTGLIGWLMWLVVHLAFLTGFKNRLATVAANWTVAFVGRGRRERTITKQQTLVRTCGRALEKDVR